MTVQPKTQLLKDPNVFPSVEVIARGLGTSANAAYVKFLADLEARGISKNKNIITIKNGAPHAVFPS